MTMSISILFFFFFNDTATTEIYTLSLHDALPIWNEERQNLAGAALQHVVMRLFDHRQAADTRADIDADARGIRLGDLETGVFQRLNPGCDAEMDEAVHAARLFRRQIRGDVEIPYFACDLAGEQTGIEMRDAADGRLGGKDA